MAADVEELAYWLNSSKGKVVTHAGAEATAFLCAQITSLSFALPLVQASWESFDERGAFQLIKGVARLAPSGHAVLEFHLYSVSFSPVWANPLWGWIESNVSKEASQIRVAAEALWRPHPSQQQS